MSLNALLTETLKTSKLSEVIQTLCDIADTHADLCMGDKSTRTIGRCYQVVAMELEQAAMTAASKRL